MSYIYCLLTSHKGIYGRAGFVDVPVVFLVVHISSI